MFLEKQDPGAGHVRIDLTANEPISGSWGFINGSYIYYSALYNTSPAIGNKTRFKVFLAEGSYRLYVAYSKHNSYGILKFNLDDEYIWGIDLYNATSAPNQSSYETIRIRRAGIYNLDIFTDEKNPASSNYYLIVQSICFVRQS